MTVGSSVEAPAAPAQQFDVTTVLDRLQARVRAAEDKAAGLERALATNRRIGIAIGILMCRASSRSTRPSRCSRRTASTATSSCEAWPRR